MNIQNTAPHAAHEWTVIRMTVDIDLIRRSDAIAVIHGEMKKTITPARKGGFRQSLDLLRGVPSVTVRTRGQSRWFYNAGWFFCEGCGGRAAGHGYTPFCPHCGDEMIMPEIE